MRILWLKTELLHPIDKGGKIRTYQMLRELRKEHHVTYLCLDDGTAEEDALKKAEEYAHKVITVPHETSPKFTAGFYLELIRNVKSALPYALEKYVSVPFREAIEALVGSGEFDLVICDFLAPAVNVPSNLPIPTLLFQHNVEAMIWRRHFEVARNPIKKLYFKMQWERMRDFERESCRQFNRVLAVSEEDAEVMRQDYGVKNISHVATGVDTEYFAIAGDRDAADSGCEIVFTGSMDWLPNEDGVQWFTSEILPKIKKRSPGVTFSVVGRSPSSSLLALANEDKTINVTGRVPDVRPYMRRANVFVVPIRIGGGTRLKIYEAMAVGLPVVSTTVGAEGLRVRDGVDVILRDDSEGFAEAVVTLLNDKQLAHRVGTEAAAQVQRSKSWSKVAADFTKACVLTTGNKAPSERALESA